MAVIQVPLEIPADIAAGLSRGVYKRFGSVVRDTTTNKIIAHLKDARVMDEKASKVSKFIGDNKVVVGVIGAIGLLAVGGSVIYHQFNQKSQKENPIDSFTSSFEVYLETAKDGNLSKKVVSEFKEELENFNLNVANENFELDETVFESLSRLIKTIHDYTIELAKANKFNVNIQQVNNEQVKSNLILLEDYLNTQEKIFEIA